MDDTEPEPRQPPVVNAPQPEPPAVPRDAVEAAAVPVTSPAAPPPAAQVGLLGRAKARALWALDPVKEVVLEFIEDDAFTLAAGLAYYTALSFAPLVILLLAIASYMPLTTQENLRQKIAEMTDPKAAEVVNTILESSSQPDVRTTAGWISIATLLFSASGVFAQLQAALNRIWDVKPKPGGGVKAWLRKRVLSFGMVLALAFILIVSVAATAIIAGFFGREDGRPGWLGMLLQGLNIALGLGVFTLLFGLIFKYLPDVHIGWRDVWVGAFLTAVLFSVGRLLLGRYLGNGAVGSSYGAAGSLIALLVWVYYSALILFLGAEVTEVYAKRTGSSIEPDEYAVRIVSDSGRVAT